MRTIVAMTGASGSAVAIEFLKRCPGEKYLVVSRWGRSVLFQETGLKPEDLSPYVDRIFAADDLNAPFASGTTPFDQYVILPCSVTTLARIANGVGENLVARIGEVALKENRRIVMCLRESPLSAVALENALKLSRLGVTIMPMSPAFYFRQTSIEEMIADFAEHVLGALNLSTRPGWRASELPA